MELPLNLCYAGSQACTPRHSFGPAVRTQYLLHFILSGAGRFQRGEQLYRLEANSVFLIQPGELTYYEADEATPWEYCWVGFDGPQAVPLLEQCGLISTPVKTVEAVQAAEIIRTISSAYRAGKGNAILYTGLLYQFLSYLMVQSSSAVPAASRAYWSAAVAHIRKNFMYDITISSVAAFVGVDRSYLYRLFQTYQKQSPQQYLLKCRIDEAIRLLSETPYSVTEVSYSCGFQNVATFDRAFRSRTGITPSAYRKCHCR